SPGPRKSPRRPSGAQCTPNEEKYTELVNGEESATVSERGALWDEAVQARDPVEVRRLAADALAQEWTRVWELPVPYFRDRFRTAGLAPDHLPALDDIPITTKPELRADELANPPFGTHRVVGLEDAIRLGSSTGTTGVPTLLFFGRTDVEVA